jgi:hypothetical protein
VRRGATLAPRAGGADIGQVTRHLQRLVTRVAAIAATVALAGCGSAASLATTAGTPARRYEVTVSKSAPIVLNLPGPATPHGSATATASTSSTVTVAALVGSKRQQATITVTHQCGPAPAACRWFGAASQYAGHPALHGPAKACPIRFDATRAIWVGAIHQGAGSEQATVTFQSREGVRVVRVCVYAHDAHAAAG